VAPFAQFPFNLIDTSDVEPFPIKIRELFNEFKEKSFSMQMTVLECLMVSTVRVTGHVMKYLPLLHFFSKEILRATDGVSGLIILSVDLCAVEQNCLSCNARNEQTNGVLSWKASSLGSASSITRSDRKSVWDDSRLVLCKLSELSLVMHYGAMLSVKRPTLNENNASI
jgi:hypothetical protein